MNCYFCKSSILTLEQDYNDTIFNRTCQKCSSIGVSVENVIEDGELVKAILYVTYEKTDPAYVTTNIIIYHVKKNMTYIHYSIGNYTAACLKVSGQMFTPSNVRNKLKLYLLFS